MDGERFDAIAKALSSGASRRRVLRGMVGSATVRLLSPAGAAGSDDKKTKKDCAGAPVGTRCRNGKLCCDGRCVMPCADGVVGAACDCFGICCPSGETCSFADGTCYCTEQFGTSPCGDVCCAPDETACFSDFVDGVGEFQECRPCLMNGPLQHGVPCCRITACSGGECLCLSE